jgi:hypothetical protein
MLIRQAYRNLTDVTLETIKSFSTSITEIDRRAICLNPVFPCLPIFMVTL